MSTDEPLLVLYRWRIHPGQEDAFIEAWTASTKRLLALGSLGSRLHRGSDGLFYSYAQWPSEQVRAAAFERMESEQSDASKEQETPGWSAVAERLPEVRLHLTEDYLRPLSELHASTEQGL